jgi:hypothetical protein
MLNSASSFATLAVVRRAMGGQSQSRRLAVLLRTALVPDVRRTRSANEEVSQESASFAYRAWSTTSQATSSIVLRVTWGLDRNNMMFRLAAWTAEGDRL